MKKQLLPFQVKGIEQIVSKSNTLFADDMGLGKTIQAIGAINHWKGINKILIICPASVKLNWVRELDIWLDRYYDIYSVFGKQTLTKEILRTAEILIINYDLVATYKDILNAVRWDLKVVDECQYLNGMDSQRTGAVLSIWGARNIFMSGTPADRPVELYPMLRHLDPNTWPRDIWKYYWRFCDPKLVINSATNRQEWNLKGSSRLDELRNKLYKTILVRRTKDDVMTELKPKVRKIRYCPDPGGYLAKEKQLMSLDYETAVDKMYACDVDFGENLAITRRELGVDKIPFIIKTLDELTHRYRKVVCYVYHTDVLNTLKNHYRGRCVAVNGKVNLKERERAKAIFKYDDDVQIYFGQIKAMGTGTDGLQEIANVGLFAELDWSFKNVIQAEDRIHRFGQNKTAEYIYLVVRDSLEEYMIKKLQDKRSTYNAMFDKKGN